MGNVKKISGSESVVAPLATSSAINISRNTRASLLKRKKGHHRWFLTKEEVRNYAIGRPIRPKKKSLVLHKFSVLNKSDNDLSACSSNRLKLKNDSGILSTPVEPKDNNSQSNVSSKDERSGHDAVMNMADAKALPAPPFPTPEKPDESKLSDEQKSQLVQLGAAMEALLTSESYDPLDQKSGDSYMDILFEYPREVREVYLHKRVQEFMGKQ